MKKRILSCLMALALCLTLLPTAALAEETEGTAQTPPAVEKLADPANGEAKQENQPAEAKQESQPAETKQESQPVETKQENQPAETKQESQPAETKRENQPAETKRENQPAEAKQENQPVEQGEQQEDSASKQAVADVQAMIDALPDAEALDGMDDAEAMAVYEAFQTACEAYYDLTEEQQAQLENTEKLAALSDWFSQLETLAEGEHQNHCVCGKSGCTGTGHGDITFNKWLASSEYNTLVVGGNGSSSETYGDGLDPVNDKYVLPEGSYYLKTGKDVTIKHPIQIKGTVTICLNGQTIQSTATDKPVFEVVSGSLTLTDCKNNQGKVTHASGVTGGGVEVNGGEFNLYGGKITGNTAANGGGVKLTGGTVNMYGGEIAGNKATGGTSGTGDGGGVYVSGGTFNLRGGSITNNKTEVYSQGEGTGGGVYVSGGTFNLYDGGSITHNKATGNASASKGGGVRVGSNGQAGTFNMYGGEITYNEANYGGGVDVYEGTFTMSGGTIANNTTANYGGGVYVDRDSCKFTMRGGSISGNTACNGGGVFVYSDTFTMSGGEIKDNTATGNGGGVYVNGSDVVPSSGGKFTVSGKVVITGNKMGNADNNVYLLSEKNPIIIGRLDDGASIGVTTKSAAAGVAIATGTSLNDGDAKKFESDLNGFAVSVKSDGTGLVLVKAHKHHLCGGDECTKNGHTCSAVTFTQWTDGTKLPEEKGDYYLDTDVKLSSTWEPVAGVVLCLNGHSITMNGVNYDAIRVLPNVSFTLTDCKGEDGEYGQITHTIMPSGTHYQGGGVMVKGGEFLMFGGKITKNKTNDGMCGGGVMVNGGTFNLYGGEITNNEAYMGGGVMVSDSTNAASGKFNMYGGSITNNTANYNKGDERGGGGGVAVDAGTFTMSGSAEITGNHAECGGGVYEGASGAFTMNSGAKIANNEASGKGGGVYMGASGSKYKFQMTGGEIANNTAVEGGGVYAGKYSTSQFTMTGGEIKDNTATNTGGGVYVTKMTFNMSGGTIARNNAENQGGGVYAGRYGTFTMNAGEISGNKATSTGGNGGGVYADGGGRFDMKGGTIARNNAENKGGGVFVSGTFNMTGGTIGDGNTASEGGGVYANLNSGFNMSGSAKITGNHAENGGGVYVYVTGIFKMNGGEITGNTAEAKGGGVLVYPNDDGGTFTVSGTATVKENTKNSTANNVYLVSAKNPIIIGEDGLTGGASIGVTTENKPTEGAITIATSAKRGDEDRFVSDEAYQITYDDSGKVVLATENTPITPPVTTEHTHFLCTTGGACDHAGGHTCAATGFDEWTSANALPDTAGSYYLDTDVTLYDTWTPANGTVLCLNGHSITVNGDFEAIKVSRNATFTLTDCQTSQGSVTHADNKYGRGVEVEKGTFNLYGGSITGNNGETMSPHGGGVYVANGVFNMYGGKISGNKGGSYCLGGGVYVVASSCTFNLYSGEISSNNGSSGGVEVYGTFNMTGGSITNNTANYGGGVEVRGGAAFNMSGGSITNNTASCNGTSEGGGVFVYDGTFTVSGSANITGNTANNVYLYDGKTIAIGEGGLSGTIGVTTKTKPDAGTPVTVIADTKGITGLTKHVVSDDNAYKTAVDGSAIVLRVVGGGETHTHTYDGTWKYDGTNHWQECTDEDCPDREGSVRGETAHVYDNDTDTICNVCGYVRTVTTESVPVESITLNKTSTSISVGNSEKLTATVKPENATNKTLNWASSDTSVATVAADGTVTAVKAGAATITATATDGSGKSAACTVTVTGGTTPSQPSNPGGSTGGNTGGGGGSSSDRDSSDSNPIIKTETKTNADGSTTKTETRRDGSVTQTTTGKDGSVTKTETKKDGSSVTENKAADGSTGTVKTDKNGQTEAKTALSNKAVEDAKRNGEAVKAPVEVEASRNSSTAPTVKVELPKGAGETKVEIPVSNVKSGTVAVIVHPDGTEEIVKDSVPTEDGIQLTVDGNATVKIVDNSKGFIDTRNHWAEDAIDFVSARGLVNGMSATIYAPNNSTTRAQLWTILARQADADLTGGNTWYEKAQNWAKAKGVSDGANPNAAINRAQMVTMLWRAKGQPTAGGTAHFTDVPADAYYAQAVSWAVENGITTGVGNGRFDPTGACTRAQIAAFLARSMK